MVATQTQLQARMKNPAVMLPGAMKAIQALIASTRVDGLPETTLELVHMRASQINGCGACLAFGAHQVKEAGDQLERYFTVAGWREAPYFTDAERAALALTEAMTRLSDRPDAVSDEIWDEAKRHFNERELAALVLWIATTNLFNRVNVTTRQVAGAQEWS